MLKAIKENREYTVTEETKQSFLNKGFDIYDTEKKKIVEKSTLSGITKATLDKALAEKDKEIEALKKDVVSKEDHDKALADKDTELAAALAEKDKEIEALKKPTK
ncbi:MAG: hypothetical protein ACK5KR_08965 [Breznakia sp.]